jgi:Fe2+ transport system protein FeoA
MPIAINQHKMMAMGMKKGGKVKKVKKMRYGGSCG